jgi:integrase
MSAIKRLTAREVASAKPDKGRRAAMLPDGGNLYLQATIGKTGEVRRSWVFRYEFDGLRHDLGLGSLDDRNLVEAREKARELRQQLVDGIDPFTAKREAKEKRLAAAEQARADAAKRTTFGQCVETFLQFKRHEWSNPKHAAQWEMTLREYAKPLHEFSPASIDLALVVSTLQPIWLKIPETAGRTRQRIEAVLDHWAATNGIHDYTNPAAWERVKHALPSLAKIKNGKHYPALPYDRLPEFMGELRNRKGIAPRALEFMILTSTRTGDICGQSRDEKPAMLWRHVDTSKRIWIIPSTKTETELRVPLSSAALTVLREMGAHGSDPDKPVFHGTRSSDPLSNAAMAAVIDRMNEGDTGPVWVDPKQNNRPVVPHGFRSTFRDWASEETNFPERVVEMCLAHKIKDKVEAAYRRGDLLERRRSVMTDWAMWCERPAPSATVTPIRAAR